MSKFMEEMKKAGKIKPASEAFENYPVHLEDHKGDINYFINEEDKDKYIEREQYMINKKYELIKQIGKIRNESNLSQKELCLLIGMKQPALARIENGVISPGIDTLLKILYPLGYTIEIKQIEKV